MDKMLMQIELTVIAGDQESYRMSAINLSYFVSPSSSFALTNSASIVM
jgi:hypothetical protein